MLTRYPHSPAAKVGGTSEDAARSMDGRAATLRTDILSNMHQLAGYRWTADEMAEYMHESILSIRPRFSELKALGLICDTGLTRKNASGRSAAVWSAIRPGEQMRLL